MPNPENLQVDDLHEGQRICFAPELVGVRHGDFGRVAGYVAFVERVSDALVAELIDGRRYEIRHRFRDLSPNYSLCWLTD
jgi:hypothetical protein